MASSSLGTLTLDLAVRLSEFTDGLSQAERETRNRTQEMGDSVGKFKEKLIDDLSGTAIGDAVGSLNEKLSSITEAFGERGLAGAATIGAASVIGSVVAIGAGLVTLALQTAETDQQLQRLATRANTSTANLQVLTAATAAYGLEMDSVGDILADAQEKLGEFSATGGGGLVDTLELMQNATKKTDAELEIFGKSLSTMDSVDAIQAVVNEMEKADATTQEVRFVTESLASGLGDIIPLWDNNGEALRNYERDLNEAGVIRTKESIEQSKILADEVEGLKINFEGVRNELVTEALPAMATLIEYFKEGTKQGGSFKDEISGVGQAINITAASVVGIAAGIGQLINAFSAVGMQMRNIGQTAENFFSADTLADKGKALFTGFFSAGALASGSMLDISSQWARDMETIDKLLDGASSKMNRINTQRPAINNSFGSVLGTSGSNVAFPYNNNGIPYRNGAVDAEIKATRALADAAENEAKARERTAKATADASKYIQYANKGATRNQRLNPELEQALSFLQEEGIVFKVNSGGQPGKGSGGKRVGSTAHDHGYAADGDLYKGGKKLDWNNSKDLPLLKAIVEEATARGINGIGAGNDYMGAGRFHFGIQQNAAAWGKDGKGANAPGWLKAAHSAGMSRKSSGTFYGKALAQDAKLAEQAQREQARLAAEALRQQEEILRKQASVAGKWAHEKEKIELDYQNNVTEVKEAYAEGSADYIKYMARVEEDYTKAKNAGLLSITEKYFSEEQKIHDDHKKEIAAIEKEFVEGDPNRTLFVDLQKTAYEKDLENFRWASGAKAREQDEMYQSIANSARANSINSLSTGLDSMAQRTMSDDDYAVWRLRQDRADAFGSVNNQYSDRQKEINAKDERGKEYLLPELERNELLEIAKQEHLDNLWAMEQDYALKQQTLDDQLQDAKLQNYGTTLGAMGSLLGAFAGENNRISQMMFSAQKGYALAQIFMNNKVALSEAWASAPFPYNVPAVTMAALETGALAAAAQAITPMFSGIAHGGLDYVPKEQTYLLDKGERVLSPNQNKDFTNFMQGNKNGNGYSGDGVGEINIVVSVDAKGNSSVTGDTANTFAKTMAQQVEQTARNVVRKELMQGGMIDKRLRR